MAGERILVCDDDPQILRALRLVLRGAGYEVLTSTTGEEALDRAAIGGPHAAIIDLMLPDRPGIEVCRELRSWSELPIIVLSALTDEQTKIEVLQNEADGLVVNLATHDVTVDGRAVHLTPIEFALLRELATNRGLLMTHRKLL